MQRLLDTKVVSRSIDAFAFNDSLIGLIAYKIVIGEGGAQTDSFKELQHYASMPPWQQVLTQHWLTAERRKAGLSRGGSSL